MPANRVSARIYVAQRVAPPLCRAGGAVAVIEQRQIQAAEKLVTWRVIGQLHVDGFNFVHQLAVSLGFFGNFLPFRIAAKGGP